MSKLTRRDLKKDEFASTYEGFEQFAKEHYQELIGVVVLSAAVAILVVGWRRYQERQTAAANALLGQALKTFSAYVGPAAQGALGVGTQNFPTAAAKYQKALQEFNQVAAQFPRQKAAAIARYHAGVCQAELGNHQAAIQTLRVASEMSDDNLAALAKLALAGELAATGNLTEAAKIYIHLESHPTLTVPRATAMLALADAYRATQPAKSRQIYEQMQQEFASNAYLAETLKQQLSSLPP